MNDRLQPPFDANISRLIKNKARRLSRLGGFNSSDFEPIETDLRSHLWCKAAKFNPAITTWEKFASFILDKRCISLLRQKTAAKRCPRREECSLNEPVRDADGRLVDRHQTTPEASRDGQWLHDLQADLRVVREHVSEEAWLLVRGLVDASVAAVAREHGWSRATVSRHLSELRDACEDLGLREYLR